MELRTCSKALPAAKTAKVLATGILPAAAKPAAVPIMSCSEIPMLKYRSGATSLKAADFVALPRSASRTTTFGFLYKVDFST